MNLYFPFLILALSSAEFCRVPSISPIHARQIVLFCVQAKLEFVADKFFTSSTEVFTAAETGVLSK